MRVVALCARSFAATVERAAGVRPVTFPPMTLESFDPAGVARPDLLYVKLHGIGGQPFLYGDGWVTALAAEQVAAMDLRGSAVFAAICFLEGSPVLEAFFQAGAQVVMMGDGRNWGGEGRRLQGSDLVGIQVRRAMERGLGPGPALGLAKLAVRFARPRSVKERLALADARAFRCVRRVEL